MPKHYRIEIDVRVDEGADTAVMGLARTQYHSGKAFLLCRQKSRAGDAFARGPVTRQERRGRQLTLRVDFFSGPQF
jgi:hypothetical protein